MGFVEGVGFEGYWDGVVVGYIRLERVWVYRLGFVSKGLGLKGIRIGRKWSGCF